VRTSGTVSAFIMSPRLLPRQQWDSPPTPSRLAQYAIHVRFLGVNPTVPHDLIASMLFCLVFAGLMGGAGFLGRTPAFRSIPLYTLALASLFLFLAFAIRAGIANASDPRKSSFVAQSLFFVFAQLCVLDAWMARIRDEYIDFLDDTNRVDLRGPAGWKSVLNSCKKHSETRWVMVTRGVIWPLCLTLYMVGYATLPSPDEGLQTDRHGATRQVASFLLFIVLTTMQAMSLKHACFALPPWLPFTILFAISLLLWLPALYAFCLLAVVPDDAAFVKAKTFFYVGYGFAHAAAIGGLLALHRRSRRWKYPVAQDDPPIPDEPKEPSQQPA